MALFHGSVYSKTLDMQTLLYVVIPQNTARLDKDGRYPVLFLLHGLSDNAQSWSDNTGIARYAEKAGIAVVMPEVARSFYADITDGMRYLTFASEELPELVRTMFPLSHDPKCTFIAGLSMGGHGALKIMLHHPERFAAVGCFSGAPDAFGGNHPVKFIPDAPLADNHVPLLLSKDVKEHIPLPPMYITCGLSDFLYEENKRFRQQLDFLKVPYVYEEWAGAHEWSFWDRSVQQFLQFIGY